MARKSRANYVPNANIKSITVQRGKKTTEIKNKDILDGAYVKKGVKYAKGGSMPIYQTEQEAFDIKEPSFQSFLKANNIESSFSGGASRYDSNTYVFYGTKPALKKMLIKYWFTDESKQDANRLADEQIEKVKEYAKGGSMKVGDKKVYNKLVGRKGNEYYFLDYVFKHDSDFMGATGTVVMPVNKDYYEYATSADSVFERFSKSDLCNVLGLDEENCTEEEIIDGIQNQIREGELQPFFEECSSDEESQMREIAEFSDSDEYPLFAVVGAGRIFNANDKFDEVYDKTLLALIKKAESGKLAKGGSMYRTGGVAGSKRVDVAKGYRLEHGYKAIRGEDKNKDYSKGKPKVKVDRGYRLPSGYEVVEGAYNKKYEDGGGVDATKLSDKEMLELKVLQGLSGFNNGLNLNGLLEAMGLSNYRLNKYANQKEISKVKSALSSLIKKGYVEESGLGYTITQEGAGYRRTFDYGTYAKGGGVSSKEAKAMKQLEKHIKYNFVNTDMGSGWEFYLDNFDLEMRYLDIFDAEGIEDYNSLSKEDKKYYYDEWKEDLWQSSYEHFKQLAFEKYGYYYMEDGGNTSGYCYNIGGL